MARIRIFIVLALAVVAGGTFAYGTYNYVQSVQKKVGPGIKTTTVIVAATDLDLGAELQADDLKPVQWPANAVPEGVFGSPEELVGRGLIQPIAQNEPFMNTNASCDESAANRSGAPTISLSPSILSGSVGSSQVLNVCSGISWRARSSKRVQASCAVRFTLLCRCGKLEGGAKLCALPTNRNDAAFLELCDCSG